LVEGIKDLRVPIRLWPARRRLAFSFACVAVCPVPLRISFWFLVPGFWLNRLQQSTRNEKPA